MFIQKIRKERRSYSIERKIAIAALSSSSCAGETVQGVRVHAQGTPMHDSRGAFLGIVGTFSPITA